MKRLLPAAALLLACCAWSAESAAPPASAAPPWKHSSQIDWKVSGDLPPGAEYALLYEDPSTHGVQLVVRFPAHYALPPHSHSHDETIFVVKGKLKVSAGGKSTVLEPGSYAVFPAGLAHGLEARGWGGCTMLVSVNGPYDVLGLPSEK